MEPASEQSSRRYLLTLSLGALGVVYGDIGTSPLYALRECFRSEGMALWRDDRFVWTSRNASSASQYFALPPNQVIELGAQIEM